MESERDSDEEEDTSRNPTIPFIYHPVKIKLSKLGISDFDFSQYNKTTFVGLENSIPNSFSNSVIQMMYLVPEVRATLLAHSCPRDTCLSCELGFLFHMLDQAKHSTGCMKSVQGKGNRHCT